MECTRHNELESIVPINPSDNIDWITIENRILPQECYAMNHCMQSPCWHKEGDVWSHTKMVCNALIGFDQYWKLDIWDKTRLFLSALFHDIGKPSTSKEEDEDIVSKGHAKIGARIARKIMRDYGVSIVDREIIVSMIQAHSAPYHAFLNNDNNSEKIAIRNSLTLNNSLLYLLCRADLLGRIADNINQSIEDLELFFDLCKEKRCFIQPFPFQSDHSRFMYFYQENRLPDYEIYDDTKCMVYLLSGLPGSGKDYYYEKHLLEFPIVSLDNIRNELDIKPEKNQGEVIQKSIELCRKHLRNSESFVFNATNISKFSRSKMVNLFCDYHAKIKVIYIEPKWPTIIHQNKNRSKQVPENIIHALFDKLDMPNLTESHMLEIVL